MGMLGGCSRRLSRSQTIKKKKKNGDAAKQKRPSTAMFARTLSQDGVVWLNSSLSAATAAALREDILKRRDAAFAAVISPIGKEQGGGVNSNKNNTSAKNEDCRNYFADVLLSKITPLFKQPSTKYSSHPTCYQASSKPPPGNGCHPLRTLRIDF